MELDFSALRQEEHKATKLDIEQASNKLQTNAYAKMQLAIMKGESLRSDIVKGIKEGESPYSLLLKAIECIAAMTGDASIFTQAQQDILDIHGEALRATEPLQILIEQTQQRLILLEQTYKKEKDKDTRQRINEAIKAHRRKLKQLKAF